MKNDSELIRQYISTHAMDRIEGRLTEQNVPVNVLLQKAARLVPHVPVASAAVLLCTLPEHKGSTEQDYYSRSTSNGNQVWMIVRDNRAVTFMLRRDNQPSTPEAMRVEKVYLPQ